MGFSIAPSRASAASRWTPREQQGSYQFVVDAQAPAYWDGWRLTHAESLGESARVLRLANHTTYDRTDHAARISTAQPADPWRASSIQRR